MKIFLKLLNLNFERDRKQRRKKGSYKIFNGQIINLIQIKKEKAVEDL